jgi:hypothetical protein
MMFGVNLNTIGAAVLAAVLAGPAGYLYARAGVSAEIDAAIAAARAVDRENTENAIAELADEVDRARVRWRLCVERGGVWSFTDNECDETEAQP